MNNLNSAKAIFNYIKDKLTIGYSIEEAQSLSFIILQEVVGVTRIDVLSDKLLLNNHITEADSRINNIIKRLLLNEPIQYIFGETEFYNCKIKVTPAVLIPRPETEELVDLIIKQNQKNENLSILDLCTGSGCIAIALSKNFKSSATFAIDISKEALKVARINAAINHTVIEVLESDILKNDIFMAGKLFDIIVSNPPYVMQSERAFMQKNVLDFEPSLALFVADSNPLLFYKRIVDLSVNHLKPNGKLYFEINEQFGQEVTEYMSESFFTDIKVIKDLFDKDRFVSGIFQK